MAARRTRALITIVAVTAAGLSPLTITSASAFAAQHEHTEPVPSAQGEIDPAPCAAHLAPTATYHADGATYRTDEQGRPERASADNVTHSEAVRGSCQGKVGHMSGTTGYDGGHLIAATLHGVDRRYDLVPQWARVNRGVYQRFEAGAKRCLKHGGQILHYRIRVSYPDATTLIPDAFQTDVEVIGSGPAAQTIRLTFPNRELTSVETRQLSRAYEGRYLAAGCGAPEPMTH